jgi:hypothetical protein
MSVPIMRSDPTATAKVSFGPGSMTGGLHVDNVLVTSP